MEEIKYMRFVSVNLGLSCFVNMETAMDDGTSEIVGDIMKIMYCIYGRYYDPDELDVAFSDFQFTDGCPTNFTMKVNGRLLASKKFETDSDDSGGMYVLFSDGINFYKFYMGTCGYTLCDDCIIAGHRENSLS